MDKSKWLAIRKRGFGRYFLTRGVYLSLVISPCIYAGVYFLNLYLGKAESEASATAWLNLYIFCTTALLTPVFSWVKFNNEFNLPEYMDDDNKDD